MIVNAMAAKPPSKIDWAQNFADAYLALSQGEGDVHALLDWAYELWPAAGDRQAEQVAKDEFVKVTGATSA